MCGICGIINYNREPVREDKIRTMMQIMKHRGPDDEGTYIKDNIGLGFVRLSIIDLTIAGHQPMFSNDGRYVIVFNGEIYNYIELKQELKRDYNFRTNTDTEVILAAYTKWGKKCLEKLNGMWAFAILNIENDDVFFARDRFGIKPFYYYSDSQSFYFASDIPPLYELLKNRLAPNDSIIYDYLLTNRTNHNDNTFFKGIKRLKQSNYLLLKGNKIEISKYYSIDSTKEKGFLDPAEFRELFRDSVKLQLRSDVPVGTMLSGGLDSSAITSVALKDFNLKDIHTFSAVYGNGEKGDESKYIDEYSSGINNLHRIFPTDETLYEDLDDYFAIQPEPIPGTSPYAEYKVMKIAKNYCTVVLNGQGPDEIMGGYHYFFSAYYYELIRTFHLIKFFSESFGYYSKHKSFLPLKFLLFYATPRFIKYKSLEKYRNNISGEFINKIKNEKSEYVLDTFYKFDSLKTFILNHFENKFEHMLLWADKNGMAFSLETRFPFLDHRLIEKLFKTDTSLLMKNGVTKIILRESMKDIVPEKIIKRMDKVGFQTPEDNWIRRGKLKELIYSVLSSKELLERGIINQKNIVKLFNKHIANSGNYGKEIWKVFHLEMWFKKYFN